MGAETSKTFDLTGITHTYLLVQLDSAIIDDGYNDEVQGAPTHVPTLL